MNAQELDGVDPLQSYYDFHEAIKRWMDNHKNRFVVPSMINWPDKIDDREEALNYYSYNATTEILEHYEDIVIERLEADNGE